jgi:hypothetical protein
LSDPVIAATSARVTHPLRLGFNCI